MATRTAALVDALTELGKSGGPEALARLGQRKELVVRSSGFLVAQYRMAALRKVVRRADPVIGEMTEIAVA